MNKDQIKTMTELAAKAVGYEGEWDDEWEAFRIKMELFDACWEPYHDDGDSRRLQLILGLSLEPNKTFVKVLHRPSAKGWVEWYSDHISPAEAARAAVLRAASELGTQGVQHADKNQQ